MMITNQPTLVWYGINVYLCEGSTKPYACTASVETEQDELLQSGQSILVYIVLGKSL